MTNIALRKPLRLQDYPEIDGIVRKVEKQLDDPGRVLLRPSGTEPLLRVMVEGHDAGKVRNLTRKLAEDIDELISG